MADEKKLEMSLDDIIKNDKAAKKSSMSGGTTGAGRRPAFKTGGRGGKTTNTRGRGGARGALRGGSVVRGGRLGNRRGRVSDGFRQSKVKEANRIKRALNFKLKRERTNSRLGQRRQQNALLAKLIAQRNANRRQNISRRSNFGTKQIVSKLLKRALNTRTRIARSRIARDPANIRRVSQAINLLNQRPSYRFAGRFGGRRGGKYGTQQRRSIGISNAMLSRLGGGLRRGTGAFRRNNRVQLTNYARGRGLAAREAHMDAERRLRGQRVAQVRQQRQFQRQQQIISQRERALQRLQIQQMRAFNSRRGLRGGRRQTFAGTGRGALGNDIKNLIQNTVYQAVAQASTALQRREAALPRRQPGMLRMDQYDLAERRQPAYSFRAQPLYDDEPDLLEERIQSRPIRRAAAGTGRLRAWANEYDSNPMRQAFAGSSSSARTLDERFGGGSSRISVAGGRQYLF